MQPGADGMHAEPLLGTVPGEEQLLHQEEKRGHLQQVRRLGRLFYTGFLRPRPILGFLWTAFFASQLPGHQIHKSTNW